jgi:hypothetical protein
VDAAQFDRLAKMLCAASTRRRTLAGLLGLGLAGLRESQHVMAKTKPKKPKRCKKSTCPTGCCALSECVIGAFDTCGTGGGACIDCHHAPGLHCNTGTCECRPGRGCCIRDGVDPRPNPCSACCSGACLLDDPLNGCLIRP